MSVTASPRRKTMLVVGALILSRSFVVHAAEETATQDDVMQPTRHGLRLTPQMARGFSTLAFDEEDEALWSESEHESLSETQRMQMREMLARRMMLTGHRHGRHFQPLIESWVELLLTHGPGLEFTPESAREFAGKALPVIPAVRESIEGMIEDGRPILTDEQFAEYEAELRRGLHEVNRGERKMKRWAEGRALEVESLQHFEPEDGEPPPPIKKAKRDADNTIPPRLRRARWLARLHLRDTPPSGWNLRILDVSRFFAYDEAQLAEAEKLQAAFAARAEAIKTPTWIGRFLENRTKFHLRQDLGEAARRPWVYHLEREHREWIAPLDDLSTEFWNAIVALATDEQVETAMNGIRAGAAEFGLTTEWLDDVERQLTAQAKTTVSDIDGESP